MNDQQRQELITYRIEKAKEALNEAKSHIQNEFWNSAVNRLYYSCFYAVSALLASKQIYAKTHLGIRQMFALHYVKPGIISNEAGKFYTTIFDMRHTGDYTDFIILEKKDVIELLGPATGLIVRIEEILSTKLYLHNL